MRIEIFMKTLRILALHATQPDITSVTTLFFENLLPVLKKQFQVHMIWVIYRPEKIEIPIPKTPDTTILDMHDYDNAIDIIKKTKPDLIYAQASPNFVHYAFSIAGKFLNVPVFSSFFTRAPELKQIKLLSSYFSGFFRNSVQTDVEENQKQLFRRGKYSIYRFRFLLKTLKAMNKSRLQIVFNSLMLLTATATHRYFQLDTRFQNDLHWLVSESYFKSAIEAGFNRSTLVLTGNPMFDSLFKKLQQSKPSNQKNEKIRLLFLTVGLFEHGIWTRAQRDSIVQGITREISKNKEKISLAVKIHPSSEVLFEYQSLIHKIDPTIPIYQKDKIDEFLKDTDVVITFVTNTALEAVLLSRIPIIICNFYYLKGDVFLERNLAIDCKKLSDLIPSIYQILKTNPASKQKVDDYIRDYMYRWDGQASERVCDAIITLLKKK